MTNDGELERRRRAAIEQTRRMFANLDKDYDAHTDIDGPVEDIDEDELDDIIEALEDGF